MYEDVKSENLVAYLIHRGPAEPNHWFRTVPIGQSSVSIIGGLVEPDVVSVEQPTIRETEVFGLPYSLPYYSRLGQYRAHGTIDWQSWIKNKWVTAWTDVFKTLVMKMKRVIQIMMK